MSAPSIPGGALKLAPPATRIAAVARLELGDVLRSRWLVFSVGLYAALTAAFVCRGMRESAILGGTGMTRLLLSLTHALLLVLPLLALTGTGHAVSRPRRDGTLELLFGHPVTRDDYFRGVTLVRFGALFVPLLALMVGLALIGAPALGQAVPWAFVARSLVVSTALLWCFTGLGLAVSVRVHEPERVQMYLLLIWVLAVALLDFGLVGLMLQWAFPPAVVFGLAAVNPVEAARLALLSGADPALGTLGPVGFFLFSRLGPAWLLAIGVLWPLGLGTAAWLAAVRWLRRSDLV